MNVGEDREQISSENDAEAEHRERVAREVRASRDRTRPSRACSANAALSDSSQARRPGIVVQGRRRPSAGPRIEQTVEQVGDEVEQHEDGPMTSVPPSTAFMSAFCSELVMYWPSPGQAKTVSVSTEPSSRLA